MESSTTSLFNTVYGRNLVGELKNFVHQPALVVTMEDLWDKFAKYFPKDIFEIYFVNTLDNEKLKDELKKLPAANCVIGLGGGQALDIAKFFAWKNHLPLFQLPTATTVNAAFGHRTAIRFDGKVRYIGWAIPEAVYIDYDVVRSAPAWLNRSGVGDIFCYYTAYADWKFAQQQGKTEPQWPYDAALAEEAQVVLRTVMDAAGEIHDVTDHGIRTLMNAHRWGGATFHNAGWNPRHIEGFDHFLFYALEYLTGKHFLHGQPVCLGVYIGTEFHCRAGLRKENEPDEILNTIHRVGVDIRPEAMGVTWDDVKNALEILPKFVVETGLWYTIANEIRVTDAFVRNVRQKIENLYGKWE